MARICRPWRDYFVPLQLAGSMAELNARLLKERKIWRAEIAVLNEELAKEYHLITA